MDARPQDELQQGIFLMHAGLPPTIIESQVLSHVRTMHNEGVQMEVWTFAVTKSDYEHGLHALPRLLQDHGIRIQLFRGVRPALPLSCQINALLLLNWLLRKKCKPHFIHARTEYSVAVAATIKNLMKFRLVWDARGDTLSEFKDAASLKQLLYRWLAPIKIQAIKRQLMIAAKECDRAFFVSEALRKLQGAHLDPDKSLVMPCLADEKLFYYDPALRSEIRKRLGYSDEHVVIVYSGSTASWQCVPETIELMSQAIETNIRCRALVVTTQPVTFERLVPRHLRDRFTIMSSTLHEINGFLNAADIGVMLRKTNAINHVASPVKFGEYSLTGLQVLTTDAVEQVYYFGKLIGNLINPSDWSRLQKDFQCTILNREKRAKLAIVYYGRHSNIIKIKGIYQ
jgi:hypothetical protein